MTIQEKSLRFNDEMSVRPREHLVASGAGSLSDMELLSVLIGWGTRNRGVTLVAREILELMDGPGGLPDLQALMRVRGVGTAKAAIISAALEFARRRLCPERRRIAAPADVLPLVSHFRDRKQEHFLALSLNGAHEVIAIRVISVGLVNRTVVHPREVFADAIADRASGIIACHNHPSGRLDPSPEDRSITRRLTDAGSILGIQLLDHVIISERGYYSFLEQGEL